MTQQHAKPIIAAFDFDGTLTRRDSLLPFLWHVAGPTNFIIKIIKMTPTLTAYMLGFIRNDIAKNKVLHCFIANMDMTYLQQQGRHFAEEKLPALHRHEAMQRFYWHKLQGHRCIVVSASLEIYLRPWAQKTGFDDILGSQLAIDANNRTSGHLLGENCFGPEKVHRLESLLGLREGYTLYAYGDSRGDKELLSAADFPYFKKFSD